MSKVGGWWGQGLNFMVQLSLSIGFLGSTIRLSKGLLQAGMDYEGDSGSWFPASKLSFLGLFKNPFLHTLPYCRVIVLRRFF